MTTDERCHRHRVPLTMDLLRGAICPICDDDLLHAPERAAIRAWARVLRWLRLRRH